MLDREKVTKGLELCNENNVGFECCSCPYYPSQKSDKCIFELHADALAQVEAQQPRVMTAEEVADCEEGTVLWVEERQGVTWNLFPLEIDVNSTHPDTGTNYLFFITYHDIRKFECDQYNRTWRCWTERPTDEQRKAAKWDG